MKPWPLDDNLLGTLCHRIIGIVKWKSGPSELDCQLTTGVINSLEPSCIGIIGSVK